MLLILNACAEKAVSPLAKITGAELPGPALPEEPADFSTDSPSENPTDPRELFREEAARIASSLDDAELAGQCLLAGMDNKAILTEAIKSLFAGIKPGGVMLFRYNLSGTKEEVRSFLRETADYINELSRIPPFMAVDHEGGDVHRFGPGVTRLPSAASFWEKAAQESEARALTDLENLAGFSAAELRDLGITMNLAPVAEILTDENAGFLETRSYGRDADFTEKAAAAFIRGMESRGIACVVKHFPGSGRADPHLETNILGGDPETIRHLIQPFQNIIANPRPAAIMISHSLVPAIDPEKNASLSPAIISDWLRGELGFTGIILADDFSMGAVASRGISAEKAAVEALNAGVDMIMCWPDNMVSIHGAILSALRDGRLERGRLVNAVQRIITEKLKFGLFPPREIQNQIYHDEGNRK